MSVLTLAALGLSAFLAGAGPQSTFTPVQSDGLIYAPKNDRELAAARRKAVARLGEFFRLAQAPPPGVEEFHVKIPIRDGREVEHFWVKFVSKNGDQVTGVLANRPVNVSNVQEGQTLTFSVSEIEDWNYMRNGRMQGGYSVCVLLARQGRAALAQAQEGLGLSCR